MPAKPLLPSAIPIAFVPFCVDSLSRTRIDRVFNAHSIALPQPSAPFSKTNLVDEYLKLFDWRNGQDVEVFLSIASDVFTSGDSDEKAVKARETFRATCTRQGFSIVDGQLVGTATGQAPRPTRPPVPVRTILFLASSPVGKGRLRLDKEVREITEGLQLSNLRDAFKLVPSFAVRIQDLRRGLLTNPQIVHFAGHGDDDGILVENEKGRAVLVPFDALAELFGLCKDHVECVILNACRSDLQAEAIAKHIQYVIGMSASISDAAAIEFAVGFYDALGAGKTIEEAFLFARNAVALKGIPEDQTPVLLRRDP